MRKYIFIHRTTNNLYITCLKSCCDCRKKKHEFISYKSIRIKDYIEEKAYLLNHEQLIDSQPIVHSIRTIRNDINLVKGKEKSDIVYTNVQKDSNTYKILLSDYGVLRYFDIAKFDLEYLLFKLKDLIFSQDLAFNNDTDKQRYISSLNNIENDLFNNIRDDKYGILLSLTYLIAAINFPPGHGLPLLPVTNSFYTNPF